MEQNNEGCEKLKKKEVLEYVPEYCETIKTENTEDSTDLSVDNECDSTESNLVDLYFSDLDHASVENNSSTPKAINRPKPFFNQTMINQAESQAIVSQLCSSFISQQSSEQAGVNITSFEDSIINEAPIVHLDNIECKSEFEAAVMMRLDQLCYTVAIIKKRQDEIAKDIASLKVAQDATTNFLADDKLLKRPFTNFESKYQITLPMNTYEDFQKFEEKLKGDKFFKSDIRVELRSLGDKDLVTSKCMVKMLRRFLTRDLANQFTAIRSSTKNKNKYKFKPTELCKMIYAAITEMRSEKSLPAESGHLNGSLTDVLSNVGKWKC